MMKTIFKTKQFTDSPLESAMHKQIDGFYIFGTCIVTANLLNTILYYICLINQKITCIWIAVNDRLNPFVFQTEVVFKYQLKKELEITIMSKVSRHVNNNY